MDEHADEGCGHRYASGQARWMDLTSVYAQGKSLAREEVHKSLSAVLHPHILALLSPFALYTLHNDVYPVVPTGTIVPKVNI